MDPQAPKISVVLCVFNAEKNIKLCVQSILDQIYSDFELLIVNDGSTDRTEKIILEMQKKDSRIFLRNIRNFGLTKALNVGLRYAKGEYIARMDADDFAFPKRFAKQVAFLEKNSKVGVVGTGYQVTDVKGKRRNPKVNFWGKNEDIKRALPKYNPFFHASTMIRRSLLEKVAGYDEDFIYAQDYDLWFRLSKVTEFSNLNEVLMLRYEDFETIRKESKQNWYAIKVRLKAIKEGNSKPFNIIYTIRPFLVMVTPIWLRETVRKLIR